MFVLGLQEEIEEISSESKMNEERARRLQNEVQSQLLVDFFAFTSSGAFLEFPACCSLLAFLGN